MPSTATARECVSRLLGSGVARRGPFVEFPSEADLSAFATLLEEVLDPIRPLDSRTWWAPSPWHAAAWLRDIAAGVGEHKAVWPQPTETETTVFHGAPLFRGQRDATWGITPSLFRQADVAATAGGDFDHERYDKAMRTQFEAAARFRDGVGRISPSDALALPDDAHIATAQHYGLPTHFLDVTADPLIATWFANDRSTRGNEAAVFWMPFDEAIDYGLRVILAPPWVRRIYRQLGLFVDMLASIEAHTVGWPWYRIVFPADPAYGTLYADEARAIYTEDPWFEAAAEWARTSTLPVDATESHTKTALAAELLSQVGEPPFVHDAMFPSRLAEWPNLLAQFLDWLALKKIDGELHVDCSPIRIIARDNPDYMNHMRMSIGFARRLGESFGEGLGQYADAIEGCLAEDLDE